MFLLDCVMSRSLVLWKCINVGDDVLLNLAIDTNAPRVGGRHEQGMKGRTYYKMPP